MIVIRRINRVEELLLAAIQPNINEQLRLQLMDLHPKISTFCVATCDKMRLLFPQSQNSGKFKAN